MHELDIMQARSRGFTIVELIIVVILLGILSMTAISRSIAPSAFSPRLLTEALSSAGHHASQLALSDLSLVSIEVSQTAEDYIFTVRKGATVQRNFAVDRDALTLLVSNNGTLIGPIDTGSNLVINLDRNGNVISGVVGAVSLNPGFGIEVSVQGATTSPRCIQPTGYFAETGC